MEALSCGGAGCSLRSALANARASSTICIADDLSIALATSPVVTSDITIVGSRTSICGTGANREFHIAMGGALRLRDLSLCHGRVTDVFGAGVLVDSWLGCGRSFQFDLLRQ